MNFQQLYSVYLLSMMNAEARTFLESSGSNNISIPLAQFQIMLSMNFIVIPPAMELKWKVLHWKLFFAAFHFFIALHFCAFSLLAFKCVFFVKNYKFMWCQEYSLALRLCYNCYLMKCCKSAETECVTSVLQLKETFFPAGLRADDTPLVVSDHSC